MSERIPFWGRLRILCEEIARMGDTGPKTISYNALNFTVSHFFAPDDREALREMVILATGFAIHDGHRESLTLRDICNCLEEVVWIHQIQRHAGKFILHMNEEAGVVGSFLDPVDYEAAVKDGDGPSSIEDEIRAQEAGDFVVGTIMRRWPSLPVIRYVMYQTGPYFRAFHQGGWKLDKLYSIVMLGRERLHQSWLSSSVESIEDGLQFEFDHLDTEVLFDIGRIASDPRCGLVRSAAGVPEDDSADDMDSHVVTCTADFSRLVIDGISLEASPALQIFLRAIHRAYPRRLRYGEIQEIENWQNAPPKPFAIFRSGRDARLIGDRLVDFDRSTRTYGLSRPVLIRPTASG